MLVTGNAGTIRAHQGMFWRDTCVCSIRRERSYAHPVKPRVICCVRLLLVPNCLRRNYRTRRAHGGIRCTPVPGHPLNS